LRLLAGWAVGTIGGFFLAFLGESGASVSTATQQLISDIWPVFGAAGCVSALGILVTLWDLLGPRFESLCIGEGGVAVIVDKVRTDYLWSDIVRVDLVRSFYRGFYFRVVLHDPSSLRGERDFDIRTDLMSLRRAQVAPELEAFGHPVTGTYRVP